jgi:hypothetical protein
VFNALNCHCIMRTSQRPGFYHSETSLQTRQGEFPVVDGMGRPVGLLARNDIALKERGPHARVADAMTSTASAHRPMVSEVTRPTSRSNASTTATAGADFSCSKRKASSRQRRLFTVGILLQRFDAERASIVIDSRHANAGSRAAFRL